MNIKNCATVALSHDTIFLCYDCCIYALIVMFVTLMLIFEISRASFFISCFSLQISCEIKKNFLAACCHAGGLSHALL
jgi:hypothetical protein